MYHSTKTKLTSIKQNDVKEVNRLLTWFDINERRKKTKVFTENSNEFSGTNVPALQGTHWSENRFRVLQGKQVNSELFVDFLVVPLADHRVSSSSTAKTLKENRVAKRTHEIHRKERSVKRTLTPANTFF